MCLWWNQLAVALNVSSLDTVRACVHAHARARACVRAWCVHGACVRACVHACVRSHCGVTTFIACVIYNSVMYSALVLQAGMDLRKGWLFNSIFRSHFPCIQVALRLH